MEIKVVGGGSVDGIGTKASFHSPAGICADNLGNLFVTESQNGEIRKVDSNGKVTTLCEAGTFEYPHGICVDRYGNLYICEHWNHVIRRLSPEGELSIVAGTLGKTREDSPYVLNGEW